MRPSALTIPLVTVLDSPSGAPSATTPWLLLGVTDAPPQLIGRFPARTRQVVRCTGRGCPRTRTVTGRGWRGVHRLLRTLTGRRYRSGDVLAISLTAPGWLPERARVTIRDDRKPLT